MTRGDEERGAKRIPSLPKDTKITSKIKITSPSPKKNQSSLIENDFYP
jgi:hypothetical protein